MKEETQRKINLIIPLLAHHLEGGDFTIYGDKRIAKNAYVSVADIVHMPGRFKVHKEPRVIYVNELDGIWVDEVHSLESSAIKRHAAKRHAAPIVTRRFIEDVNWKPELDADHHLPEPSAQAKAYQSTV